MNVRIAWPAILLIVAIGAFLCANIVYDWWLQGYNTSPESFLVVTLVCVGAFLGVIIDRIPFWCGLYAERKRQPRTQVQTAPANNPAIPVRLSPHQAAQVARRSAADIAAQMRRYQASRERVMPAVKASVGDSPTTI